MRHILLLALGVLTACSYRTRCPYRDLPPPKCRMITYAEEDHLISEYDDCPVEGCPWQIIMHKGTKVKLGNESPETLRRIQFGQSLTLQDLRILSAQGIPDEAIVYQLDRTGTEFQLTSQQLQQLQMWDIRPSIIEYIENNYSQSDQGDDKNK